MAIDEKMVAAVWEKARVMNDHDPNTWRKDQCGAWLRWDQYQHKDSEFGWKVENVSPGGADELENLYPFHLNNSYDIENGRAACQVKAHREDHEPEQRLDKPRNMNIE